MATNKNAQLRYQVLDRCFSNLQRRYTIEDLVDEVNDKLAELTGAIVSLRQVRDDIKYMRERDGYNAPIEAIQFDGKKCYYQYSDPDFRIFRKDISEEAIDAVRKTIQLLGQYRGLPTYSWMEDVITSLEVNLGIKANAHHVVSLDTNSNLKGLNFLSDIIDYTINGQPIAVEYQPYGRDLRCFVIHPYHVKQYNNRWFLWGLDSDRHQLANLALDRICSISKADVSFVHNTMADFSTFFNDVIGVSVPSSNMPAEHFVLQFSEHRFPYIVSKPLHTSQKIAKRLPFTITLDLKPNREFESIVLSYGPDVKVLAPKWFQEQIAKKIAEIHNFYLSVQNGFTDNS